MCKYCDLVEIGNNEFSNNLGDGTILSIKDGSRVTDVFLNRYIVGKNRTNKSALVMDSAVKVGEAYYTIKSKEVKIKYCPFCGEKL